MTSEQGNRVWGAALCGLGLWLAASPAVAGESDAVAPAPRLTDTHDLGTHQKHIRLEVGARTQFIKDAGLDPFATNDALAQVTLAASYAFWAHDQLSLAGLVGFDYGGASATARSDKTSLDLYRFTLAPELRYHVLRVLAVTAKVGPTLTRESAEISGALDTPLQKTAWKVGFDATLGAAVELWGYQNSASKLPRVWLIGEGGYGWTAPMQLGFKPEDAGAAPQRLTALELRDLSVSGPLVRITAALSFW